MTGGRKARRNMDGVHGVCLFLCLSVALSAFLSLSLSVCINSEYGEEQKPQ